MIGRFSIVFLSIGVLFAVAAPVARASCNSVPDAAYRTKQAYTAQTAAKNSAAPNPSITALVQGMDASEHVLRYKGALGRIGGPFIFPEHMDSIKMQADGLCVRNGPAAGMDAPEIPEDIFAAFVVEEAVEEAPGEDDVGSVDKRADVVLVGSQEFCDMMNPAGQQKAGDSRFRSVECVVAEIDANTVNDLLEIEVDLSPLAALKEDRLKDGEYAGASAAVVTAAVPARRGAVMSIVKRVASAGCAGACSVVKNAGGLTCIDRLYALLASAKFVVDPIPCKLHLPATIKKKYNDFQLHCDKQLASPGALDCKGTEDVLQGWQDECGGLHFPFRWHGLLSKTSPSRIVRGRAGAARKDPGGAGPIPLPGREFIGSTPYEDVPGNLSSTNWRSPIIDLWTPVSPVQTLGLEGIVDEENSILHIYPRMPAYLTCSGKSGEACMSVENKVSGNGVYCACEDRYAVGCTCDLSLVPQYFQCTGSSSVAGKPCTRHQHCNPGGKCDGLPTCVKKGKVWEPGAKSYPLFGCRTDADCAMVPGDRKQCGHRLFNLKDSDPGQKVKLYKKVDSAAGKRPRRGFCSVDQWKSCTTKPPANPFPAKPFPGTIPNVCFPLGQSECRGYMLSVE